MWSEIEERAKKKGVEVAGPGEAAKSVIIIVNPFPTLFSCGRIGCAEAPEIVPEGPGYRC